MTKKTKALDGQRVRLRTSSFFPKTIRAIGAVFCIFGLGMVWSSPVIGLLFIFITTVIFTTHYGFEIAVNPNSFREFVWVLGWREGRPNPFKAVEFLFIQRGKTVSLTYMLQEKEQPAFEGYIKFEGRNEVHAFTELSKEKLFLKMKVMAARFGVEIKDYSDGNPIVVFESSKSK